MKVIPFTNVINIGYMKKIKFDLKINLLVYFVFLFLLLPTGFPSLNRVN